MKRNMKRSLCVLLAALLALSCVSALAEEEKETVYVLADAQGRPQRVIANESDRDGALPFAVGFRYELDGREIAPADLAGKSGHLTIRIDYASALTGKAEVKGEEVEMPIPLLAATVLPLDRDVYANVEVTNGKVIEAGRLSFAVCFGLPGLGEALNAGGYAAAGLEADLPAGAVISADVTNYKNEGAYTVVTGIPAGAEETKLPFNFDVAGVSSQLKDAMKQLTDGAGRLTAGTGDLLSGANELAAGTGRLSAGADTLNAGAAALSKGLNTLNGNSAALNAGADQIVSAVLDTVNETLGASAEAFSAAGIELKALTLDNYAAEIDRLEGALLKAVEAKVYEQADAALTEKVTEAVQAQVTEKVTEAVRGQVQEKVTAAVREQVAARVDAALPDAVREKVTEAVQAQVTEKVTAAAGEQIGAQLRQAGVVEEQLPAATAAKLAEEQTQAAVAQQVSEQMASPVIKALIDAQTAARLTSDEVKAQAAAETDRQMASDTMLALIREKTEEAMQGEEARAAVRENTEAQMTGEQIAAVIGSNVEEQKQSEAYLTGVRQALEENGVKGETYQALEALRGKLAGVKAFREGLSAYTAGVGQANEGAQKLASGADQLHTGAQALNTGAARLAAGAKALDDGMGQLKNGLAAFDQEAVQKLTGYLDGDVRELLDRAKAVLNLRYGGYLSDAAAATLFIVRTEGI